MKSKRVLFIVLVLLVGLVACGKGGDDKDNLKRALAMLPGDAPEVLFTDWSLIKEYG